MPSQSERTGMDRRRVLAATAGLAAGLAGCTAPATRDPNLIDIEYSIDNQDEDPVRVRLFVLAAWPVDLDVTYDDGATATLDGETALGGDASGVVVGVDPADEPLASRGYRTVPGDGTGGTFDETARGAVLLWILEHPDRAAPIRAAGVATCDGSDAMAFSLRARPGGVDSSVICGE